MNKIDAYASRLIDRYQKVKIEFYQAEAEYINDIDNSDAQDALLKKKCELIEIKDEILHLYRNNLEKGRRIINYLEKTGKNFFTTNKSHQPLQYIDANLLQLISNLLQDSDWHTATSMPNEASKKEQHHRPLDNATLTKKQFDREIQKGLDDFKDSHTYDTNSVNDQLHNKKLDANSLFRQSNSETLHLHLPISMSSFPSTAETKQHSKSTDMNALPTRKKAKQNLRYPDHSSYHYIITNFKKRGITIQEMAEEAMQDQLKHGVTAKRGLYEKAIETVIHKRDNMSLIMFGLAMDDLCTKKLLPQPIQYIMENDLSSFSTDELVGVCLSMPYSGIAVTNFGARDVHKSGLAKKLDEDTQHCNVFVDDIVSALIGDAEAIVAHKYQF